MSRKKKKKSQSDIPGDPRQSRVRVRGTWLRLNAPALSAVRIGLYTALWASQF